MRMLSCCFVLFAVVLLPCSLLANNLSITNVAFVNVSGGEADIAFDVSWDNSWRTSWDDNGNTITVTNWDAVWVFAKFRQSGGLWKHVMLTEAGHSVCSGLNLDVPVDNGTNMGAMIYRNAEGSGSVTCEQVRLHWNYAASGLAGTNEVDIAVMGIEMVYIPGGSFYLGSGGNEGSHLFEYPNTSQPYLVTSEDEIVYGASNENLYVYGTVGLAGTIPAAFPKGYASFYCMKYEMSQGQYADFLNLLDAPVASLYYPNAYGATRHTINYTDSVYRADAPDRSCNYLNAQKILAYLDWSGLRPMTELEFEKICRGPRMPVINEFPWGTSSYVLLSGIDGVDGSGTETALPTNANCHGTAAYVNGPVRVGIFATDNQDRERAGSSYFGVTDMAGNSMEFVVQITRPEGRMFTDEYGDGNEYNALPSTWQPPPGARAYTHRGGWYYDEYYIDYARTSSRPGADGNNVFSGNGSSTGLRGVRTIP